MPYITIEGPQIDDKEAEKRLIAEVAEAAAKAYNVPTQYVVTIVRDVTPKAGRRILVIDDEPGIRSLVKDWLGSKGYDVIGAEDGLEGLKKAETERPSVIILDIMMPVMDGFTVLQRLKNGPDTWRIPVIMLTERRETETIDQATAAGAIDYVMKPFSVEELLNVVKKYSLREG